MSGGVDSDELALPSPAAYYDRQALSGPSAVGWEAAASSHSGDCHPTPTTTSADTPPFRAGPDTGMDGSLPGAPSPDTSHQDPHSQDDGTSQQDQHPHEDDHEPGQPGHHHHHSFRERYNHHAPLRASPRSRMSRSVGEEGDEFCAAVSLPSLQPIFSTFPRGSAKRRRDQANPSNLSTPSSTRSASTS